MKKGVIYLAGTDFSHLTNDELIKGIRASNLPDYIRSKSYGIDVRETLAQMTEMTIQLGVNMGLSPDDALSWARKLQESVSQSEFDSWVATLLDGGPSIFMNTLSELQSTYPNGAAGVALVRETDPAKIYVWNGSAWEDFGDYQGIEIKNGTVTTEKIADNAVTPDKLSPTLKQATANKFNKETVTSGYYSPEGAYLPATTLVTSDNISVSAGDIVYMTGMRTLAPFDTSGSFMPTHYKADVYHPMNYKFVVPTGVASIRVSFRDEYLEDFMVTINENIPNEYVPFHFLEMKVLPVDEITEAVSNPFFERTENEFDNSRYYNGYVFEDGSLLSTSGTLVTTHRIPVSAGDVVSLSSMRTVAQLDATGKSLPALYLSDALHPSPYQFTVGEGVEYIMVSFRQSQLDTFMATINKPLPSRYVAYKRVKKGAVEIETQKYKTTKFTASAPTLSAGGLLQTPTNALKKNKTHSFSAKITNFDGLRMGQGEAVYGGNYIEIDQTQIKVYYYLTDTVLQTTMTHGLTISGFIDVLMTVDKDCMMTVRLMTNNGFYESKPISWRGYNGTPFVKSIGSTLTNCELVFNSADLSKPIWAFGDSYFGITSPDRWVNFIREWGFDNWLVHGFPGQDSRSAILMAEPLLKKATPEMLIWALGMNNGDDKTAVNNVWKTDYDKMRFYCDAYNIELVLCTIPNVPTVNNSFRNEIVRNSGYRYIDFAKAVGAENVGSNWYAGMLSSDKVHPTILGAQKLALRALQDVPELAGV